MSQTPDEAYPAFLRRVHMNDVAKGQGIHRPGQCQVCDEVQSSEQKESE